MPFRSNFRIQIDFEIKHDSANFIAGLEQWTELGLVTSGPIKVELTGHDLTSETLHADFRFLLNQGQLLQGLAAWESLGLLNAAQIQGQIWVPSYHPALMEGLDEWARLGLLSPEALLALGRTHLACDSKVVPEPAVHPAPATLLPDKIQPPEKPKPLVPAPPVRPLRPQEPTWPVRMMRSLMAELSIIWLLLLGVVLVLLSSSVLVANQWSRFTPAGQYGILWAYTLAFGGAAVWASSRANLHMTAKALAMASLLLMPLNFIAMDGFGLRHTALGLGVMLSAAVSLGGLTLVLLRLSVLGKIPSKVRLRAGYQSLWLSLLHWGWGMTGMPVLAVYLGVVGIAGVTLSRPGQAKFSPEATPSSPPQKPGPQWPSLENSLVGYGLGLLFIRAILSVGVPLPKLALAIGIVGFLLAWTTFRRTSPESSLTAAVCPSGTVPPTAGASSGASTSAYQIKLSQLSLASWEVVGLGLLLGGWGLSVATLPWQAMGVSILAGLLLSRRLLNTWSRVDLAILLLIGLQMIWLGWDMVPDAGQEYASNLGKRLVGSQGQPWAALSLVVFPYVMAIVALSDWFARHRQRNLARFSGGVALGLGFALTGLSTLNPTLRFLNLLTSTILLAVVTRRRWRQWSQSVRKPQTTQVIQHLATLTHIAALLTVAAFVARLLPELALTGWSVLALALMMAEWGFSLGPTVDLEQPHLPYSLPRLLRQSAWPLCLVLAGLTLEGLYVAWALAQSDGGAFAPFAPQWGLVGLAVPILLTTMTARMPARHPLTTWLSSAFLVLSPLLFWDSSPTRLAGLAIATGLLGLNSRYLLHPIATRITIGFGLLLAGAGLYEIVGPSLDAVPPALLGAALLLWIGRQRLLNRQTPLAQLYRPAMDQWAFGLSGATLAVCFLAVSPGVLFLIAPFSDAPAPQVVALTALGLMITTTYRSWQPQSQKEIYWFSGGIALLAPLVMVDQVMADQLPWQSLGLALGTGLMVLHTRQLRQRPAAIATVGLAVALFVSLVDPLAPPTVAALLLVMACATFALWGFWFFLRYRPSRLAVFYRNGADVWGLGIGTLSLVIMTIQAFHLTEQQSRADASFILAAALLISALLLRQWRHPRDWGIYGLGWGLELLTLSSLSRISHTLGALAVANIVLGIAIQMLGSWLHRHHRNPQMLTSWHLLPLMYGALGAVLRTHLFTPWTGFTTLGLVIIAVGVGRRQPAFKPLIYLALVGISATAFELLFYQIQVLTIGDQLVALAALSATLVYGYRLSTPWLAPYLHLETKELIAVAHIHWAMGSVFLLAALDYPLAQNAWVGLGAGVFLVRYALMQGRGETNPFSASAWVYLGGVEALGVGISSAPLLIPDPWLQLLLPWTAAFFAVIAATLYGLPWQRWGWPPQPWQVMTQLLPLVGIVISDPLTTATSLLIVAGFYGFISRLQHQPRWSYLTVLLVDWAMLIWLTRLGWLSPFAWACLIGLSILYGSWVDPDLKPPTARPLRHGLRLIGSGVLCMVPLVVYTETGLLPAAISLVVLLAGLMLRIRAFLYMGTAVFLVNACYQLLILSFTYPLLKWIIGLLVGLAFILIAASFETRRTQLNTLLSYWAETLQAWE